MKRLLKKSAKMDHELMYHFIQSVLDKKQVREYMLEDLKDFARSEFESDLDKDEDVVLDDYKDAVNLAAGDIIEAIIDEIMEEYQNYEINMSEDEFESYVYTKDFSDYFIEELFEKYLYEMAKVVDNEKADVEDEYESGNEPGDISMRDFL